MDMTPEQVRTQLAEQDPDIVLADGFEDALLGYVEVFSRSIALYDRAKCIRILMTRDGMDREDAEEFFDFNVTGAYVGEMTPAFATFLRRPEPDPAT